MVSTILFFVIFQGISLLRRFSLANWDSGIANVIIALVETIFGLLFLINGVKYFIKNEKIKKIVNIAIIVFVFMFFVLYIISLINGGHI